MRIRPLLIGPAERTRAAEIIAYSHLNPYYPSDSVPAGDNPNHVMHIEVGFTAVYTLTVFKGKQLKHLSVSIDGPRSKSPHPEAVRSIAVLFGFIEKAPISRAGFSTSWIIGVHRNEGCIVVAQEVEVS